jgi:CBS domain-containing protein
MEQRGAEIVRIGGLEAADDREPEVRTVADIMTSDLGALSPDVPVYLAGRALLDRRAPALPVVDRAGHVVGVLSEEDLVVRLAGRRRRPWWHVLTGRDQLAREFRRAVGSTVAEVMTAPVITASPTLPLASAVRLFDSPRVGLVPVVGGDRLVGTVSRRDLLRALVSRPGEQRPRSDMELVAEMRERMAEEQAWVPIPRPVASACDGLVVLWGLVDTEAQKAALETMARAIPGCRGVQSYLVSAERSRLARSYR